MLLYNTNDFITKEHPVYNPISQQYERRKYWGQEKRRSIEGMWVGGKWMPGTLYFMANHWHIKMTSDGSSGKKLGRPWIRDLEWDKHLNLAEAKGFSGFELDNRRTCYRFNDGLLNYGTEELLKLKVPEAFKKDGTRKEYIPAREYLRMIHPLSYGKPQYKNTAKNVIDLESRDTGKSYNAACWIGHNWIFDGATDYDYYLKEKKLKTPLASETLVGAIESKFSLELISKTMLGIENLPGSMWYQGEFYSSPLMKQWTGTVKSGEQVLKIKYSNSKLLHRTFEKDPLAAAGSRPSLACLEEVGFMNNIEEVLGGLEDCVADDGKQYGSIYMFGTGGYVKGNSVTHLKKIFENPADFNCLEFEDIWEGRDRPIGYFVPATMAVNDFKEGPNRISNLGLAENYWNKRREKEKEASKIKYFSMVINRPLIPSEIFLVSEGGFFPAADLKETLINLETSSKELDANFVGKLNSVNTKEATFVTDVKLKPIRDYPLPKNATVWDKAGAVELFEKPQVVDGVGVPAGTYILGADTLDKAISSTTSLASVFVMNRYTRRLVAEYTGRTDNPEDFYEICRRLCLYYNGTLMYEKNLPGLYTYFDKMKHTYLLADTPPHLRNTNTYKAGTNTSKGINASGVVNETGLQYVKSWLLEKQPSKPDHLILETIKSPALLRELILYNPTGNFDRVSALICLMWHDQTLYRELQVQEKQKRAFIEHSYWEKMGLIKK